MANDALLSVRGITVRFGGVVALDSVSFDVSKLKAGDSYAWFCSFPGHASIMKGTLTLSK